MWALLATKKKEEFMWVAFMMSLMASFPTIKIKAMVYNMVALFIGLVDNIVSIVTQYNCNNDISNEDILKVLP